MAKLRPDMRSWDVHAGPESSGDHGPWELCVVPRDSEPITLDDQEWLRHLIRQYGTISTNDVDRTHREEYRIVGRDSEGDIFPIGSTIEPSCIREEVIRARRAGWPIVEAQRRLITSWENGALYAGAWIFASDTEIQGLHHELQR